MACFMYKNVLIKNKSISFSQLSILMFKHFPSISLFLAQITGKQLMLEITFDLSEKAHCNLVCYNFVVSLFKFSYFHWIEIYIFFHVMLNCLLQYNFPEVAKNDQYVSSTTNKIFCKENWNQVKIDKIKKIDLCFCITFDGYRQ